jgi:hypothetical protein
MGLTFDPVTLNLSSTGPGCRELLANLLRRVRPLDPSIGLARGKPDLP